MGPLKKAGFSSKDITGALKNLGNLGKGAINTVGDGIKSIIPG